MVLSAVACVAGPRSLTLADLVREQDSLRGAEVRTDGVVRVIHDTSGDYFVLEDAQHDRVQLVPASRAAAFDGRRVEVVGTFRFDQTSGRRIEIATIAAASGGSPSPGGSGGP